MGLGFHSWWLEAGAGEVHLASAIPSLVATKRELVPSHSVYLCARNQLNRPPHTQKGTKGAVINCIMKFRRHKPADANRIRYKDKNETGWWWVFFVCKRERERKMNLEILYVLYGPQANFNWKKNYVMVNYHFYTAIFLFLLLTSHKTFWMFPHLIQRR